MTSCKASDCKPGKERTQQDYNENPPALNLQGDFWGCIMGKRLRVPPGRPAII
jgi:hypothetical protein